MAKRLWQTENRNIREICRTSPPFSVMPSGIYFMLSEKTNCRRSAVGPLASTSSACRKASLRMSVSPIAFANNSAPDKGPASHNRYSRKLAPRCAIQTLDHRRDAGALWASAFALAAAPPGFAPAPALAFAPAAPPPGAAFPCVVKASSNPTSRSTLRGCCRLGSLALVTGACPTGGMGGDVTGAC
jgi:hypothetical protein